MVKKNVKILRYLSYARNRESNSLETEEKFLKYWKKQYLIAGS